MRSGGPSPRWRPRQWRHLQARHPKQARHGLLHQDSVGRRTFSSCCHRSPQQPHRSGQHKILWRRWRQPFSRCFQTPMFAALWAASSREAVPSVSPFRISKWWFPYPRNCCDRNSWGRSRRNWINSSKRPPSVALQKLWSPPAASSSAVPPFEARNPSWHCWRRRSHPRARPFHWTWQWTPRRQCMQRRCWVKVHNGISEQNNSFCWWGAGPKIVEFATRPRATCRLTTGVCWWSIYFLQVHPKERVLPPLTSFMAYRQLSQASGASSATEDSSAVANSPGEMAQGKVHTSKLLKDFMHFYCNFDWRNEMINPIFGRRGPSTFQEDSTQRSPLLLQDPFRHCNLGRRISSSSFSRIKDEFERASDICSEGSSPGKIFELWVPPAAGSAEEDEGLKRSEVSCLWHPTHAVLTLRNRMTISIGTD